MNTFWLKHQGWIKDCALGLGYALIITAILLFSAADDTGFRYFEI